MTEEHKQKMAAARAAKKAEREKAELDKVGATLNNNTPGPFDEIVNNEDGSNKPEEGMVQVKKEDLDRLLNRLDKYEADIKLLYKVSDKSRLAKEIGDGGDVLIKVVKLRTLDDTGKIIIGWTNMTSNRCEVVLGRWVEEQTTSIIMEDGEIIPMTYLEFVRRTVQKIEADVISRTEEFENNKKVSILNLELPSGKKLSVNSIFVN